MNELMMSNNKKKKRRNDICIAGIIYRYRVAPCTHALVVAAAAGVRNEWLLR
jgi:hypothetical protein